MASQSTSARSFILIAAALMLLGGALIWRMVTAPDDPDPVAEAPAEAEAGPDADDEPAEPTGPPPAVRGQVVDATTQRGVGGAVLLLDAAEAGGSHPDGTFALPATSAGTYELTARAPDWVGPPPAAGPALRVRVEPGKTVEGVQLVLWPAATLEGAVRAGGQGVQGAQLSLYYESAPGAEEPFVLETAAASSAGGGFRVTGVGPGKLRLMVEKEGFALAESELITIHGGERIGGIVVDLGGSATISGVVVDERGRGVPGAEVWTSAGDSQRRPIQAGPSGAFMLEGIPAGPVVAYARALGYQQGSSPGIIAEVGAEPYQIRIVLRKAPGFGGVVIGPRNEPVEGAIVSWRPRSGKGGSELRERLHGAGRTFSDARGEFWIEREPVEPLVLEATHSHYAPSDELETSGGTPGRLVLRMKPGGGLTGIAYDIDTRRPVPAFEVVVRAFEPLDGRGRRGGAGFGRLKVADPDGRFTFEGLTPGRYGISVLASGYVAALVDDIQVNPGSTTGDIRVGLSRGGGLTGLVVDAGTGLALPGVAVEVQTLQELGYRTGGPSTVTDSAGRFTLLGLPHGPRSLTAHRPGYISRIHSGHTVPSSGVVDVGRISLEREQPGSRGHYSYSGIGAVLRRNGDRLVIDEVIGGSPASGLGIPAGTEILTVNGQDVSTLSLSDVIERIRGEDGSMLSLTVLAPDSGYPEKHTIRRGTVTMEERRRK